MNSKTIHKVYTVVMMVLLLAVLGLREGRLVGNDLFKENKLEERSTAFTLQDIQTIYGHADRFEIHDDSIFVYQNQKQIGWAYNTSPAADHIIGYTSSVPLIIGFDEQNRILGITLLENYESPDFVAEIVDAGFLNSWNNKQINELSSTSVDAITGATITSTAIINIIKHSAQLLNSERQETIKSVDALTIAKTIAGYVLLMLSLIQFFFPKKGKQWRTPLQILIVLILGFWMGSFLSMFSFYNWTIHGIDLSTKLFVFIMLVLSITLPLFTNKSYYCSHLCPFGASQDLMGKLWNKKIKLSPQVREFLSTLREKIFAILMLLLFTGVSFDLTNIEPFSAFIYQSAAVPVIVLAVVFLLLSLLIPRPWCRFACPTGYFLNLFRK